MFAEFVWSQLTGRAKEWLRLLRDSEPDMVAPVRVDPAYLTSWIRMMIANSFHPKVFQKASLTGKDLCRGVLLRSFLSDPKMGVPNHVPPKVGVGDVLRAASDLKTCHTGGWQT